MAIPVLEKYSATPSLGKQINNIIGKERYVTSVNFGTNGKWFVTGMRRDGSGAHSWWGGCSDNVSAAIKERSASTLKVSFGNGGQVFLLKGKTVTFILETILLMV